MAARSSGKGKKPKPRTNPPKAEPTLADSGPEPAAEAVCPPVVQPTCRPEGLNCPRCGGIVSRVADNKNRRAKIKRTRQCLYCGRRFVTTETVDGATKA